MDELLESGVAAYVDAVGYVTVQELAQRFGIHRRTAHRLMDRLEAQGGWERVSVRTAKRGRPRRGLRRIRTPEGASASMDVLGTIAEKADILAYMRAVCRRDGYVAATDVARCFGISRAVVYGLMDGLVEEGGWERVDVRPGGKGRPRRGLRMVRQKGERSGHDRRPNVSEPESLITPKRQTAVAHANLVYEQQFAAQLAQAMAEAGQSAVTGREACRMVPVAGPDVAEALLRALVQRHGWTWHQLDNGPITYAPPD
ncbi:helix-turn-helix domain-containing protein [Caldilinea sp.]|uniref:helix-turn-helix domain-containing protein n=1 Tax=Caldilinea sp. TaxID=2293560 RepID=UPI0021DBC6C1|nr:helix-turn-helix domain-containing protein [Caldilinea sp.]GIV73514.1 MAG: hypothetical protein KatS3mg049_2070 [Caldilinea sp.]